ncbi:class I SAM-dependent methyltransferase [Siccirubricoccus sp. G192]|uniref:class I SAM-dependent methyltransferase n=1 Tax=Siccirubricoccus sp. G192 TaxID=2849651 RepID=UPI001C2B7AD1|nr:class I SAM-dependent methyltransferase [Siccirubricoccus sp. G192]MBV1800191.1 class I SAM-dependent methyltransferase [Siccirubricoccus sp. G192]
MTEEFSLDWLDLREPFDALARSEALAARLLARLPARPRLLDLGAGTGSLFRWLAPRIGRAQAWTLVDADREMAEAAFDTIADRAEAIGLKISFPNRKTLLVHAPGGAWRVEALAADLAEAPENLPLHNADAVLSSALCDLVSTPWLEDMATALRIPFYAALCVDGRDRFTPPHPADARVAAGFRRDQIRDKGFGGAALGPAAPAAIARIFGARGFTVESAASDWVARGRGGLAHPSLRDRSAQFLAELVMGHAASAERQDPRGAARIAGWSAARLGQVAERRLALRIGHRDVLALPGERA